MITALYGEALQWADALHREQRRKGKQVSYISHLISVSALVWEDGGNEDQAIAALPLVCVACQHFRHGVDQHCHTLVACNIQQQQLQQGQHLTKICKLWARTWQSTAGWAPEMG